MKFLDYKELSKYKETCIDNYLKRETRQISNKKLTNKSTSQQILTNKYDFLSPFNPISNSSTGKLIGKQVLQQGT